MKKLLCTFFILFSSFIFYADAICHNRCEKTCCSCPVVCPEYGSWFTKEEVEIAPRHGIPFDHESDHIHHTRGIAHTLGESDFIIKDPGIYRVTYSVALFSEGDVALTLDGTVIPGSEMHIEKSEHLSTISLLINICRRDCPKLRVINNNPSSGFWERHNIKLFSGKHHNVKAAIVIEKAAECCCDRDICCECNPEEDSCCEPCKDCPCTCP